MHLQQAFTLPFDDPRWPAKLLPLLLLSFLSLVPVFGLIALMLILGWLVVLVGNIRHGVPRPVPDWRDIGQKIILGADVLLALIVVHLPLVILFIIAALLGSSIGSTVYSLLYNVGQLCCLIPLSLLYMLVMWVVVGLGIVEFSDSHKRADLYRLRYHWDRARSNTTLVSNWLIRSVTITVLCSLILIIPVAGWVVSSIIIWSAQGILLGELGHLLDGRVVKLKER